MQDVGIWNQPEERVDCLQAASNGDLLLDHLLAPNKDLEEVLSKQQT